MHPLHEVVEIDYFIPGCPPSADAIWKALTDILAGRDADAAATGSSSTTETPPHEPSSSKPPRNPETLRRVAIDPVSRVEGHGKVTLLLDDQQRVHQVRLHIVEFRGFEKFIQGRPYWEVPVMVQRLCGICPVSHHLAASKALDVIVGATRLTPTAEKIRRLMHYGQILQSHALHFFHLCSPDLLFGFDSDVSRRNIVGVAQAHPETARHGVLLRKFGQEVIRVTAGKRVHGTGSIPGGVNKTVTLEERDALLADIYQMVAWSRDAVRLVKELHAQNPALYNSFGVFRSNLMSLVGTDGALDFYHGRLRARSENGDILFDGVDYRGYDRPDPGGGQALELHEVPVPHRAGQGEGLVPGRAAVARAELRLAFPRRWPRSSGASSSTTRGGTPTHAPLAYHWARMIEMLHAVETIKDLLHDDDILGGDLTVTGDARAGRRRRHRGAARHADPPLPRRRGRPRHHVQPDRLHHAQQPGDERGDPPRRAALPARARDHRGPAQSHRGGDPRVRPLPVLRDARAGQDAARGRARRRARASSSTRCRRDGDGAVMARPSHETRRGSGIGASRTHGSGSNRIRERTPAPAA